MREDNRGANLIGHAACWVLAGFITGCTPNAQFDAAKQYEKKGQYYKAWNAYQTFVANNPTHPRAAEAQFRAGFLTQTKLGDCSAANTFYDGVLQRYPQSDPWAKAALLQKDACPDYFPMNPGTTWVEGDSQSQGKNARIEISAESTHEKNSLPNESARLRRVFYAGEKKFQTTEFIYRKKNSELLEFTALEDPRCKIILRWPLEEGASWITKFNKQTFHYSVVALHQPITVAAGKFEDCVKIQSSVEGSAGYKYEYYAPGVGKVLTTVAAKNEERRNTELMSFQAGPQPNFLSNGEAP